MPRACAREYAGSHSPIADPERFPDQADFGLVFPQRSLRSLRFDRVSAPQAQVTSASLGFRDMALFPLRLPPGADLREALEKAVASHDCTAAFVISGIGSLRPARLRLAAAGEPETLDIDLEILTLAGTISASGSHLHMSVAGADGRVLGGHVARGCIVRTTAEVLLVALRDWSFAREPDPATGFAELVVRKRNAP